MSPLLPPPESLLPPPESLLLLGIGAGSSGCSAVPQSSRGSLRFAGEDASRREVTGWPCTPPVPFRGVPHQPGAQHGGRVALPLRLSPPGQAVVPRYHFTPKTSNKGLFTSFGATWSSLSQLCPWPAWPPAPPFPLPPFPLHALPPFPPAPPCSAQRAARPGCAVTPPCHAGGTGGRREEAGPGALQRLCISSRSCHKKQSRFPLPSPALPSQGTSLGANG